MSPPRGVLRSRVQSAANILFHGATSVARPFRRNKEKQGLKSELSPFGASPICSVPAKARAVYYATVQQVELTRPFFFL